MTVVTDLQIDVQVALPAVIVAGVVQSEDLACRAALAIQGRAPCAAFAACVAGLALLLLVHELIFRCAASLARVVQPQHLARWAAEAIRGSGS